MSDIPRPVPRELVGNIPRPISDRILVGGFCGQLETQRAHAELAHEPMRGRVIAVGPQVTQVAVDDIVVFNQYAGACLTIANDEYICLREEEILVVFKKAEVSQEAGAT